MPASDSLSDPSTPYINDFFSEDRATIWMLDDDIELCQLVGKSFVSTSYHFRFFSSYRELEQALLSGSPDALILDQMMPIKSGLDVLRGLRSAGYGFPVLMLSAMGTPPDRVRGFEAGANDYLAKPFLCRELHLRLKQILNSRPSDQSLPAEDEPLASYSFDGLVVNIVNRSIFVGGVEHAITRGEAALLGTLCHCFPNFVDRLELLKSSGSLVVDESSRTIDVRMSKLKRRLRDINNGVELIESARGKGYRLLIDHGTPQR